MSHRGPEQGEGRATRDEAVGQSAPALYSRPGASSRRSASDPARPTGRGITKDKPEGPRGPEDPPQERSYLPWGGPRPLQSARPARRARYSAGQNLTNETSGGI